MDDNAKGPVPGILGQDDSNASGVDSSPKTEKIFDSSEFTGEDASSDESFVLADHGNKKANKEKKPLIFVRWYFWAIMTGIVAAAAVIVIVVLINVYDGKIRNAESIVRYDNYSSSIDIAKNDFEEALTNLLHDSYGITSVSAGSIYPSADQIRELRANCLGAFDVSSEDTEFIETRKNSGAEMVEAGESINEAQERLGKIVSGYNDATAGIEKCREIVLEPIVSKLEIKLSDEIVELENGKLSRKMTVKNNSDDTYTRIEMSYSLEDNNGISQLTLKPGFWGSYGEGGKKLAPGEEMEFDLFIGSMGGSYYTSLDNNTIRKLTPKLKGINGRKLTD